MEQQMPPRNGDDIPTPASHQPTGTVPLRVLSVAVYISVIISILLIAAVMIDVFTGFFGRAGAESSAIWDACGIAIFGAGALAILHFALSEMLISRAPVEERQDVREFHSHGKAMRSLIAVGGTLAGIGAVLLALFTLMVAALVLYVIYTIGS